MRERFLSSNTAFRNLKTRVDRAARKKYLNGLDGRKIILRHQHAALNTLLQGGGAIAMKKAMCMLQELINLNNFDGYIVPKNDEFFNEYVLSKNNRLKLVSNFSGSAGYAIILKNKNYLFVDGRYTTQARIQSGKKFKIETIPKKFPKNVLKANKKIIIGFDPKLHTEQQLNYLFKIKNVEADRCTET